MTDPLGEAARFRREGNLAAATLCLFVHQLRTLDELRLIRLAPGRTGRQLVRSIADGWIKARVEPTLRLFEASYYGHHEPTREAFDRVWQGAEELQARIAGGAVAP